MTRMGPNDSDMSDVVWAIGEVFFPFLSCFLNTNYCFYSQLYVIRDRRGGDDENRPK